MANSKRSFNSYRRRKGFERASGLVSSNIKTVSEKKGFAVSRLITHWAEVAGEDVAAIARPVEISYGRGFGATLTVLTTGAQAPMVEMQKERLRERVNACYGYAAIQKVRVTQTSATGFSEGRATFTHAKKVETRGAPTEPSPEAQRLAGNIGDGSLRAALEMLGTNVLSQGKHDKGK